jgi:hypothetical protein
MVHDVLIVTAILASISVVATSVCTGIWWLCRRAGESGRLRERIARLEKDLAAMAALLEEIRSKLENKHRR